MQTIVRVVAAIFLVSFFLSSACYAADAPVDDLPIPTVSDPVQVLPESPVILTSYMVDSLPVYVQLYNSSAELVNLQGWTLDYTLEALDGALVDGSITLEGYIEPRSYLVVARDVVANADITISFTAAAADFSRVVDLRLTGKDYATDTRAMEFNSVTRYDLSQTSAGNYTKTQKFSAVDPMTPLIGGGHYTFVDSTPLRIVEFLANPANCAPLDKSANCYQYIKIQNQSDETMDLSEYRLRFGYGNVASTNSNTATLQGEIAPHAYLAVYARADAKPISMSASGGNVWLEDTYGVQTYAETIISYKDLGSSAYRGLSWAFDSSDGTWKWAMPHPDGANNFALFGRGGETAQAVDGTASALKPCAANQYRNPETNRCKLIATTTTSLQPCAAGQYRSVETNRCRSLAATAAATQKPCNADQYRNPDTGRCKLIATTTSTLKPCATGQERNPDTNRCRKVVAAAMPAADFPVELVKDTSKAFVGWYALGGVLLLGAGFGVWEWRHEIGRFVSKTATLVHRR